MKRTSWEETLLRFDLHNFVSGTSEKEEPALGLRWEFQRERHPRSIHIGDVIILDVEAMDIQVLVLNKWDEESWIVAGVSPLRSAVTTAEFSLSENFGEETFPISSVQLWNTRTLDGRILRQGWRRTALPRRETRLVAEAYAQYLGVEEPSTDILERLGDPVPEGMSFYWDLLTQRTQRAYAQVDLEDLQLQET